MRRDEMGDLTMPDLHGIDVSHNNLLNGGPIDWNAVATTAPDAASSSWPG